MMTQKIKGFGMRPKPYSIQNIKLSGEDCQKKDGVESLD